MTRKSERIDWIAMIAILLITLMGPLACGTQEGDGSTTGEEQEAGHQGREEESKPEVANVIELSADQRKAAAIEVAEVGPGAIDSGIELLGEVRPNGDRLANISPRFPGLVREVRKNVGDHVAVGDVLAVLESSDSLAPYSMQTLIDGVILEKNLTRGEAVDRDDQVFVVADLGSVWVDLSVYQQDLDRISIGQRVRIHSVSEGPDAEGEISYLTPSVDQVTRTATARVVLGNPERKFRPGMFVTAQTLDASKATVVISRNAVQTLEGRAYVFVETISGFDVRAVTLGREGNSRVEVIAGLTQGERIAVNNTFRLKAELAKAEAEDDD